MEGLAAAAFCFALVGVVALVRTEKLIKTLKEKGVLDEDYKALSISVCVKLSAEVQETVHLKYRF